MTLVERQRPQSSIVGRRLIVLDLSFHSYAECLGTILGRKVNRWKLRREYREVPYLVLYHVLFAVILVLKQDSSYRNLEHKSIVGTIIFCCWLYLGFVEVFGTV